MERYFAKSHDGVRIRYEIRGAGAPLALVMGFGGSMRAFGEPFIQLIAREFKTIVIDNRGTGESDKPSGPWTVVDMAADLASVLDHVGVERAHVFGISMGGMIAQEFAVSRPECVSRLVLASTTAGRSRGVSGSPAAVAKLVPPPGLTPAEAIRRAHEASCSKEFVESPHGRTFVDAMVEELLKYPLTPMRTLIAQGGAVAQFDAFDRLDRLTAPTLLIHGDRDEILPHRNSEILHERIRGSELHLIAGVGHMIVWEAPEEVAETVIDFMRRTM